MLRKKIIYMDSLLAFILFAMVLLMLMLSSCKHEPMILPIAINDSTFVPNNNGNGNGNNNGGGSTCDPDSVYFQTQVLPILISNCAMTQCHNAASHQDGVILDSYTNVMNTADVRPGRAGNSDLYEVLIETDPDKKMPRAPANPLNNSQVDLIYKWIEQGAANNTCSNSCDTNNVTFSGTIFPLIQNNCLGCHSGFSPSGQIDLSNHQNIAAISATGRLFGAINHDAGYTPMPRGGNKLPECQIAQMRIWIENGSLNN
jgi:hypothetical protein